MRGDKKHTIAWEKWKDPWNKEEKEEREKEGDHWEDSDYDLAELDIKNEQESEEEGRLVVTPMGAFPILNRNSPGKVFNLWIGHTNFKISSKVVKTVANVLGVETLDVYTPYRMRVGIGKLFTPKEVMHSIDIALQKHFGTHKKKKNASS